MADRGSSPSLLHQASPVELKAQIEAAANGCPFLLYRDGEGAQRIVMLEDVDSIHIGRALECGVSLDWDSRVSRLHAELSHAGGEWVVDDDGLSRNGTLLNGQPVRGRRRLRDRDQLQIGGTLIVFRDPGRMGMDSTTLGATGTPAPEISPAQRRVLVALCRPYKDGAAFATPATNEQIARELFLTVPAVKTHLRSLFGRFGVGDLPQNEKRAALVQAALDSGAVSPSDLE